MSAQESPKRLRPGDDDPLLEDEDEESGEESSVRSIRIKLPGTRTLAILGVITTVAVWSGMLFWLATSLSSLDGSIQALRDEFVVQQSVPAELPAEELATAAPAVAEDTPEPAAEATPEPTPEPELLFGKPIVTQGADLWDCRDFLTWKQAMTVYQANLPDDPNLIDFDGNGIPCESLRTES